MKHTIIWIVLWTVVYLFMIQTYAVQAQERVSVPQSDEQVVLSKSAYADMIYLLCNKHAAVVSYEFIVKQTERPTDEEMQRINSKALAACYKWIQSEYNVKQLFRS